MTRAEPALATRDWELWSTTARLITAEDRVELAQTLVMAELARIEEACSRFRDDSEVRQLAGGEWNAVSPTLVALLAAALRAAEATDGAVDPTVGRALRDLGYDRDLRLVEQDGKLKAVVRKVAGWRTVRLEAGPDGGRVWLPEGVELDLGATAKAVAADRCAALVARSLDRPVLMNLGGDIATVEGPAEGWQIHVQDADAEPAEDISLPAGGAIATSSTIRRTWRRDGQTLHHIVDPATGRPADPVWRTVTVAAATCEVANTAATAAVVKGRGALAWIQETGLPARLVSADHEVVRLGGWPLEEVVA